MKAEYTIITEVRTTFAHTKGDTVSKVISTDVRFDMAKSEIYTKEGYVDGMGRINSQAGLKAQSGNLIQGLITGIHQGHQEKLWDSAEHLRWIIGHLEKGFVAQATVTRGVMGADEKDKT